MAMTEEQKQALRRKSNALRIDQLERDLADQKAANTDLQSKFDALKTTHDTTAAERDKLKGELDGAKAGTAFEGVARKAGVNPEMLDDLKAILRIGSEGAPQGDDLTKAVKKAIDKRPWLKANPENEEDGETESDDEDGETEAEAKAPSKNGKTKKAKLDTEDSDGDGDGSEDIVEELIGEPQSPSSKPKLAKGTGARRGTRDDHREPDPLEQFNREFAATGRKDAFRI